jgi:hypothetical protein
LRNLAIIAAAALLVSASAAFAASGQDQAKQPDPNEIVCRAGQPVTGSLLPGPRVCHTRQEWDDMQRQTQDGVSQMQVRSTDIDSMHTPGN